jgi:hypothetical protein
MGPSRMPSWLSGWGFPLLQKTLTDHKSDKSQTATKSTATCPTLGWQSESRPPPAMGCHLTPPVG